MKKKTTKDRQGSRSGVVDEYLISICCIIDEYLMRIDEYLISLLPNLIISIVVFDEYLISLWCVFDEYLINI